MNNEKEDKLFSLIDRMINPEYSTKESRHSGAAVGRTAVPGTGKKTFDKESNLSSRF